MLKGSGPTHAPMQTSFSWNAWKRHKTMQNHILHLLLQHGFLEAESGRWMIFLLSRSFTNWKHLLHHEMKNMRRKIQHCWAARILDPTRMGQYSEKSNNWSPQFPDFYRLLKNITILYSSKHGLFQLLWDVLLPSNWKSASIFPKWYSCSVETFDTFAMFRCE